MNGAMPIPSDNALERGIQELSATQAGSELLDAQVVLRRQNWYRSSFHSELVTVRCREGERVLFCKHGEGYFDYVAGVWRGPAYEAVVYAAMDEALDGQSPRCYGSFEDSHGTTLVLAFLPDVERVNKAGTQGLVRVAERLGNLHRRSKEVAASGEALNRFDRQHFELWSARFDEFSPDTLSSLLGALESLRADVVEILVRAERTVVHGELFPSNVLVADSDVFFIDWETAGIGPGELDLATLTIGGWPPRVRRMCERAYARARWGARVPAEHPATLAAATAYVCTGLASHWARRGGRVAKPWLADEIERTAALVAAL
jgi:hypothetical protein